MVKVLSIERTHDFRGRLRTLTGSIKLPSQLYAALPAARHERKGPVIFDRCAEEDYRTIQNTCSCFISNVSLVRAIASAVAPLFSAVEPDRYSATADTRNRG